MPFIRRINNLYRPEKEGFYRNPIPPSLYRHYQIDPITLCNERGQKVARFLWPSRVIEPAWPRSSLEEGDDPLYSLQLSDSSDLTQIELDFVIVNDPASPKYSTHVDEEGRDTLFGWASRNLVEEKKAVEAGLFPGKRGRALASPENSFRSSIFFVGFWTLKPFDLKLFFITMRSPMNATASAISADMR